MKLSLVTILAVCLSASAAFAQQPGLHFTKIKDGIYVETAKSTPPATSNVGIILTTEGVVLVDSGQTAMDSREVADAVRILSPLPVRFIINTETHPDHSYGHFLFPQATVINVQGAGKEMQESFSPKRLADAENSSPAMKAALVGFKLIPPHIEYKDKLTLRVGERTFELLDLGTTHSLANSAVWMPGEKVLFGAAVAVEGQINTIRPHTTIPDMLKVMDMMKNLNAEVVIPGHGAPTTNKIFDFYSGFLRTLVDRVSKLMAEGKSLEQIKQEIKMPEYENLEAAKERIPNTVEAAYRAIQGGFRP